MLTGATAHANERLLYEQRAAWDELRLDLRYGGGMRTRYERETSRYDWSGRGAAAVWRARRRVELQDFEEWLTNRSEPDPTERAVVPPGWLARVPGNWLAAVPSTSTTGIAEPYATWAADGRLLTFPVGGKQVVWPLIPNPGQPGRAPVPDIEPVLAAASGLRTDQISGFIEAILVDWSALSDDPAFPIQLRLPVAEAFTFGLIDADERREAMAQARAATLKAMTNIIDTLSEDKRHHRAALEEAHGNTARFSRVLGRLGIKFTATKATWVWPGRSVADEISTGPPADTVQWLARWAYKTHTRTLQLSMEQAWHDAFDHQPADSPVPDPTRTVTSTPTPSVTPTSTKSSPVLDWMDPDLPV